MRMGRFRSPSAKKSLRLDKQIGRRTTIPRIVAVGIALGDATCGCPRRLLSAALGIVRRGSLKALRKGGWGQR